MGHLHPRGSSSGSTEELLHMSFTRFLVMKLPGSNTLNLVGIDAPVSTLELPLALLHGTRGLAGGGPWLSVRTRLLSGREISRPRSFIQRGDLPPELICWRHNRIRAVLPLGLNVKEPTPPPITSSKSVGVVTSAAPQQSPYNTAEMAKQSHRPFVFCCFLPSSLMNITDVLEAHRCNLSFVMQGTTFTQLGCTDVEHKDIA